VIEVGDLGSYTYEGSFDVYIDNKDIKQKRRALYKTSL
jgi:hypothetical protein